MAMSPPRAIIPAARHQVILNRLSEEGFVRSSDLVRLFGVTPMTIWRDLQILEEQGLIRRERGGAVPSGEASQEPSLEAKEEDRISIKRDIASRAVALFVREGQTLAIEGGSTAAALVDCLPLARISVVTNSLVIALRLRRVRPQLPVRLLGGFVSATSGNTTGAEALREASAHSVDLCLLSATAWDGVQGPMDPNPMEIEIKRALARVSRRTVFLLGSEKFGRRGASVVLHPRRVHAVVTDRQPPETVLEQFNQHGIELYLAGGGRCGQQPDGREPFVRRSRNSG